jgi:DNA polymerase-3 subunit gamma/tau
VPLQLDAAGWLDLVQQLDLTGLTRQLAGHCALLAHEGLLLRLSLDPRQHLLRTRAQEEKLTQALSRHFGTPLRVEIELAAAAGDTLNQAQQREASAVLDEARAAIDSDPTVRALKDRFGATVQAQSVRGRNS